MPGIELFAYTPTFWGERLRRQQENNPIDYGDMQPWDYDISECGSNFFSLSNSRNVDGKKVHFCGCILCSNPFDLANRKKKFLQTHPYLDSTDSEYYFLEVGKNNFYEPEGVRKAYFDLDKRQLELNTERNNELKELRKDIKDCKKECRSIKGTYCKTCPDKASCRFDKISSYMTNDSKYFYRLYAGKTKIWMLVKSFPSEFDNHRKKILYSFLDDYFDFSDVLDEDSRELLMVNENDNTKRNRRRRVRGHGKEPEQPKIEYQPSGMQDKKLYAFWKHPTGFVKAEDCEHITIITKYVPVDDPKLIYPMGDGADLSYKEFVTKVSEGKYKEEYSEYLGSNPSPQIRMNRIALKESKLKNIFSHSDAK